jgi:hypothetical protein
MISKNLSPTAPSAPTEGPRWGLSPVLNMLALAGSLVGLYVSLHSRVAVLEQRQQQATTAQERAWQTSQQDHKELRQLIETQFAELRKELHRTALDVQALKSRTTPLTTSLP